MMLIKKIKKIAFYSIIIVYIPFISNKAISAEYKDGEHLIYNCGRNFMENWIVDLSYENKDQIKWNISGSRLKFTGGYYITDRNLAMVHGLFNLFKPGKNSDEAKLVIDREKILSFINDMKLKSTLSGDATLYSGGNMITGMSWIKINKKIKQKTIFGSDELIEFIVKISADGFKATQRTRYSKKHNRIIQFTGTSPLKYKCILQEIK
ncbi:MAG: hypothetical protein CFH01_00310 [Alphaproteobacteria bacterium MarineAlpha2_Bin1]|nr:MAG: hypothetical protein CFH01_00310 [Alphaproteobacteria bacterium MarineAlpha2_Bin1]|tara:strand:- start:30 stop:653 length:624 start_codon:yes stop_codon:yes gene_type:complete